MTQILLILVALALFASIVLWRQRRVTIIYPPMVGLLYRDGKFVRELAPGRHALFDPLGRTKIVKVSRAELPIQMGEITVISADQFSFRIGLAPVLRIDDPRTYVESQSAVEQQGLAAYMPWAQTHAALQPLISAAALEAAATKTLAEFLNESSAIAGVIGERLGDAVPGASIARILVTSINLPPETRKMFTDVERAKLEAQAGLERARGEHAALRVLANAARLISDNPALANLRLLQAVEGSKAATTIIMGDTSLLPTAGHVGTAAKPAKRSGPAA